MRTTTPFRWPLLLVAVWLGAEATTLAQTRLVGTVRDENSNPIQGATVTAENVDRTFTATTDEDGDFGFVTLRAGNWIFTASAPGFTPAQQRQRVRELARNAAVDFFLARGATGERFGAVAHIGAAELQTQLEAAEELYAGGNYADAIVAYEEITTLVPALTTVKLKLGDAYLRTERYADAETAFEAVLAAELDLDLTLSRQLFFSFGEVRRGQGNAVESMGWYWRAHESDAAWSQPLLALGRIALDGGDRAEARRYLQLAVEAEPGSEAQIAATALLAEIAGPPQ